MDDRRSKELLDERERQRREARGSLPATTRPAPHSVLRSNDSDDEEEETRNVNMPGDGQILAGNLDSKEKNGEDESDDDDDA
jgi:hypothetical protein